MAQCSGLQKAVREAFVAGNDLTFFHRAVIVESLFHRAVIVESLGHLGLAQPGIGNRRYWQARPRLGGDLNEG
jgi:hypothetical protein